MLKYNGNPYLKDGKASLYSHYVPYPRGISMRQGRQNPSTKHQITNKHQLPKSKFPDCFGKAKLPG